MLAFRAVLIARRDRMLEVRVDLDADGGYRGLGDAVTFSWLAETAKQDGKLFRFFTGQPSKVKLLSLFKQNLVDTNENAVSTASHYEFELKNLCKPSRLEILKKLFGLPDCLDVRPEHFISDQSLRRADDTYARITKDKSKFVMVFPSANFVSRQYPANYLSSIAWELHRRNICCAVFDTSYSNIFEKFPFWFYGVEVEDLAALVKRADLVVCNDSFPAHLAGTLGTPTLVLLGPTNPSVYAHLESVRTLSSDQIECTGCHFGSPFRACCDLGCLSLYRLFPEKVLSTILQFLNPGLMGGNVGSNNSMEWQ
jgi:Glycosyltransferase family 9 (heptosyltransferase)